MEKLHIDPKAVDIERVVERGVEFHGHLGPYLVAGIRMGLLALELLNSPGYFGLHAVSEAGRKTPLSCLSDGVQIGSGCTAGKGNLEISDRGRAQVRFLTGEGDAVTIALRPEVESGFRERDPHTESYRIAKCGPEELFQWETG